MRKTKEITLQDNGNELTFKIKQMPVLQLESWTIRALFLVSPLIGGLEVNMADPMEMAKETFKGGFLNHLAEVDYKKAAPLLNELLECCSLVTDSSETKCTPGTIDGMISDPMTLLTLRKEVLTLNFAFLQEVLENLSIYQEKQNIAKPPVKTEA